MGLNVLTWEEMFVTGSLLIGTIQDQIRSAKVIVAEISTLNPNVLFEVGYAMAQGKHVWLLVDMTDEEARKNWVTLGLLQGMGYSDYQGDSEELYALFSKEYFDLLSRPSAWEQASRAVEVTTDPRTLFYFPTTHRGEAPRLIDRGLARRRSLVLLSADEDERGYAPIEYYIESVSRAAAALVYLVGPTRVRAAMHNSRASLVAGLAAGLDRPVLMVAEKSFEAPIDYQQLLYIFSSGKAAAAHVDQWVESIPSSLSAKPIGLKMAMGLPQRFGDYVAEDEADRLTEYFVETAEYQRVISSGTALFVGRKGTGKTATMLRASEQLSLDRRNLVVVIKPSGYEFESLVAVLERIPGRESIDYLLDGLWQYLLHCEIAAAAVREAEARPAGVATGSAMDRLRAHLVTNDVGTDLDFSIRLERVLEDLLATDTLPSSVEDLRALLNRKVHTSLITELRKLIGDALFDRDRVAVLIDNLDKAWDRGADYKKLSRVIFGLLSAVGRVSIEFGKGAGWRRKVNVTLSVFLRADIFSQVIRHAREPDKIEQLHIRWDDPTLLSRVIQDRYESINPDASEDVWSAVFEPTVKSIPTREYLLWRVLPRPRDLIQLCNGSVMAAVNNRNVTVTADDVLSAEEQYSQFAFSALEVESDPELGLGLVLFEFAGVKATLSEDDVRSNLTSTGLQGSDDDLLLSALLRSSFLGMETTNEEFAFFTDETSMQRNLVLAKKLTLDRPGMPARYRVHPAFRPFLQVEDDDLAS